MMVRTCTDTTRIVKTKFFFIFIHFRVHKYAIWVANAPDYPFAEFHFNINVFDRKKCRQLIDIPCKK